MRKFLIILALAILAQAISLRPHEELVPEAAQHLKKGKVEIGSDDDIDSPAAKGRFKTNSDNDFKNLDDAGIKNKYQDFKAKNGKKYRNS